MPSKPVDARLVYCGQCSKLGIFRALTILYSTEIIKEKHSDYDFVSAQTQCNGYDGVFYVNKLNHKLAVFLKCLIHAYWCSSSILTSYTSLGRQSTTNVTISNRIHKITNCQCHFNIYIWPSHIPLSDSETTFVGTFSTARRYTFNASLTTSDLWTVPPLPLVINIILSQQLGSLITFWYTESRAYNCQSIRRVLYYWATW